MENGDHEKENSRCERDDGIVENLHIKRPRLADTMENRDQVKEAAIVQGKVEVEMRDSNRYVTVLEEYLVSDADSLSGDGAMDIRTSDECLEAEKTEEYTREERMEAHLYTDIMLVKEEMCCGHMGFDLFDLRLLDEEMEREKIQKNMTTDGLYGFVAERLFGRESKMDFRLWIVKQSSAFVYGDRISDLQRFRPVSLIPRGSQTTLEMLFESDRNIIFVEVPQAVSPGNYLLQRYDDENDIMMFVKLFSPKKRSMIFVGHLMMNFRDSLGRYTEKICDMAGLPKGSALNYYEEVSPDRVRAIPDSSGAMCTEGVLIEISDGGILIVESVEEAEECNNGDSFMDELKNNIEVNVHCNNNDNNHFVFTQNEDVQAIQGTINLNWDMTTLATWIAKNINFDPDRILLWKVSAYNQTPTVHVNDHQIFTYKVRDLLSLVGPNVHNRGLQKIYNVFYTKCIPTSELDTRKQMKVQLMDEKMCIKEVTVFPPKTGTVESILKEAKREFTMSQNGTGILRLVCVGTSPYNRRIYEVFDNRVKVMEVHRKIVSPKPYTARIEEVPVDQVNMGINEHLLPVFHFDVLFTRMFGVPFLFKVVDKEPVSRFLDRLREKLDVPEKQFEKYHFALYVHGLPIRYLIKQSQAVVELEALRHPTVSSIASAPLLGIDHFIPCHEAVTSIASAPLLGIDHLNKSRGARPGDTAENAIIIDD